MSLNGSGFSSYCIIRSGCDVSRPTSRRRNKGLFTLDPAQTKINFTVDSTLHTVHGDFRLKRGGIQFDNSTGAASGELVVDSASGESGSDGRDRKCIRIFWRVRNILTSSLPRSM